MRQGGGTQKQGRRIVWGPRADGTCSNISEASFILLISNSVHALVAAVMMHYPHITRPQRSITSTQQGCAGEQARGRQRTRHSQAARSELPWQQQQQQQGPSA